MLIEKNEPVVYRKRQWAKNANHFPASSSSRERLNQILLTLAKVSKGSSSQQGLSLFECLIGIVVIAVVITSFTPAIFIAVATRIQNRRAEQAIQLAQAEVDRVRRTMEQGVYTTSDLPPQGSQANNTFRLESGPGSTARLRANQVYSSSASTGVTMDVNGDGTDDFIVQTYRSPGVRNNLNQLMAFNMGVRVYAISAQQNFGRLETRQASLAFSTALGQQQRRPLAVMYTSVIRSDVRISLQCYHEFLNTALPNAQCND